MSRTASDESVVGAGHLLAFGLFAVATLAVGMGLLAIRHFALAESEAARSWVETPCAIEKNQIQRTTRRGSRPTLEIVYRYEFGGQTYRGDRLDLLIGSMGDDTAWEKRILERYPPGSEAVCYVDPTDPANSVFDRENAATKSRNLWLLAFPFLCVGACFSLALLTGAGRAVGKRRFDTARAASRGWGEPPSPPPRSVSFVERAVVLAGPLGSQLAIPFFVGFTFVFVALDGPRQYGQLLWPETRDQEATGNVTAMRKLPHQELHRSVYEYDIAYEVESETYRATSATWGQQYRVGDEVTVTYPSGEPAKGRVDGARQSPFLWWHSVVPLVVLLLLALGLTGMYANNFRVMRLLARGEVARANWVEQHVAGAIDPADDPTRTGDEVPRATTNYRFVVHGSEHDAISYGPAPRRSLRQSRRVRRNAKRKRDAGRRDHDAADGERANAASHDEATVLYDAARPHRNLLFDGYIAKVMRGEVSLGEMLLNCASAPLAAVAIWLLFAVK